MVAGAPQLTDPIETVAAGAPLRCPLCRQPLRPRERCWVCSAGHSFDVARQGYVNLYRPGAPRGREAGDNAEMIAARTSFLATGAFERLSDHLNAVAERVADARPSCVLDVGCGDGYYTRRLAAALANYRPTALGVDIARAAVAAAAVRHRDGLYVVASAFELPVLDGTVDLAVNVFGPAAPEELARVMRPGGAVLALHPGPRHLFALRQLVYGDARLHEVKDPLRDLVGGTERPGPFDGGEQTRVRYPLEINTSRAARDLLTMTPYRWHAPRDIVERLEAAGGLLTEVDVVITVHRRLDTEGRRPVDAAPETYTP